MKKRKVYVATNFLESMLKNNYPSRGEVNDIYNTAILNGALGGKLLGAGGGGFIFFVVKKDSHNTFKASLPNLQHYQFGFDKYGSKIIYSNL